MNQASALVVVAAGVLLVAALAVLVVCLRVMATSKRAVIRAQRERDVANVIKNQFVAMVSHELRTPLTSIAGFAETLEESWKELPVENVDEFLSIITKQAYYLAELVEDVLVIPRLEAGRLKLEPEIFDLSVLTEEVAGLVFSSREEGLALMSIPRGVKVWADPKRVQQVLRNLLDNARKYGGNQVLIEAFPITEHLVVVVSDNGPGVPDESVNRIFEHFEQLSKGDARSSSGIGLGLPIARRLARAMGGDVWYERRFPVGARFCFSITHSQEAATAVLAAGEPSERTPSERTPSGRTTSEQTASERISRV